MGVSVISSNASLNFQMLDTKYQASRLFARIWFSSKTHLYPQSLERAVIKDLFYMKSISIRALLIGGKAMET